MSDDGYVAARDKEWAAVGDELDPGTELEAEWGVRFDDPTGFIVARYGEDERDEAEARAVAALYPPQGERTAKVMRRRVLYGPWEEA